MSGGDSGRRQKSSACLIALPRGRACPRRCACYLPTEVHCTFRYLTSIPESIPPNVERINLGYNSLVRLTEADFSGLNKLELLMLHSNGIHTIPAKTFSDLQALQVLKMSYNKVRKLQRDTFYGLRSLTRLHMDHNNIEFINPEVFYGLTSLRLVHLEGNQLTKLHPDTFVSLRYLRIFKISFIKYLYLSDNFLSSIPQEMVTYMSDLESLYLHGNPWICDCQLTWLAVWLREKPDIIKCKKDRSPSSPQQCPLCMNPRTSKGKPLVMVPAAAFLCAKPTIDPSLKLKSLTVPEDSGSVSVSPQDFMAPFGSLTLNITDQTGNEANMICSIQRPAVTSSIAFTAENDNITLNASLSTFLVCDMDDSHIQPVWQVLALYGDSPLILERSHVFTETPQPCHKYKQVVLRPEDIFTNIEAGLRADPPWFMQDRISLQLNRTATTLSTLQIQYSSDVHVTLPRSERQPERHRWTMISRDNNTKLERTVLVGGTIDLDCPGQGEPPPHLEWLLADGSKVRAPYVSEDGRILIGKSGKLGLQMADGSDTGTYHCVSTNGDDADVLTYRVTVLEPRVEAYQENGARHTASVGETLDLPCRSTGVPDASVSWVLPGNTVLQQSSRDKQILDNGTLRLLHVAQDDQGHYRCVAANAAGVDFLVNQVLVKIKREKSAERNTETDGSGFDEPNSMGRLQDPPAAHLPTSPPMGAETGTHVGSPSKNPKQRVLTSQRRGASASWRSREHRRQLPPSAQRIDPRRWAALLEKAKKNVMPEKQEKTAGKPPLPVTPVPGIPGEEADSSGMLPPDEQPMVPATKAPAVLTRTVAADSRTSPGGPVTSKTAGTPVAPLVSPQTLSPEEPRDFRPSTTIKTQVTPKNINPTTSGEMQDTTNPNLPAVFPLLTEATPFQDADDVERKKGPLQTASPVTVGATAIKDIHMQTLSNAAGQAGIFSGSVNATKSHQRSVTGVGEPRSHHAPPHSTHKPRTTKLPSGPHTAAPSPLHIPRKSTMNGPLSRRFGRWRKIWSRGRIISPSRTPVLRPHRFSVVRPTPRGSSEESTTAFPAPEISAACPSCSPRERLTAEEAALSSPSLSPVTLPKTEIASVTAEEPTTLIFVNNHIQREKLKNQHKFGSQSSTDTVLPKISPALPTDKVSPFHFTTRSASVMKIPSVTPATTHLSHTNTHSLVSLPTMKELPSLPIYPTPPSSSSNESSTNSISMQTDVLTTTPTAPASIVINKAQIDRPRAQKEPRKKEPQKNMSDPSISPTHSSGFITSTTVTPPVLAAAETSAKPSVSAFTHSPPENTNEISGTIGLHPGSLNLTAVLQQPSQEGTRALKNMTASETTLSSKLQSTTTRNTIRNSTRKTFLSPSATPMPIPTPPPPSHQSEVADDMATPTFRMMTGAMVEPHESSKHNATPQQLAATSPQTHPNAKSAVGTIHFTYSSLLPSTPMPALVTVKPQDSKLTPSPWSENHFWHRSHPEIAEKGNKPVVSVLPTPGLPEVATHASNWDIQKNAKESGFDKTAVQKITTSEFLPFDALSRDTFERPRIIGGKAASFTVPANSDAFLPCEAAGNPVPTIHWTRVSSGLDLSKRELNSRFQVLSNGTLAIQRVDIQDRGQYLCSASNPFGTDRLHVTLSVVSYPPRIKERRTKEITVHSGSTVELTCRADGRPSPTISWILANQTVISESSKGNRQALVTSDGTLVIHNLSIYDRGFYKCVASNSVGQDALLVKIQVIAAPPVILEQKRQVIAGTRGETLKLPCTAKGTPQPSVHWVLSDGTEVKPLEFVNSKFLFSNGTLFIRNVASSDRGTYECIATSSTGSERRVVIITVEEQETIPRIEFASQKWTEVNLGDKLLLNCSATGEPKPKITWRLPSKAVVDQWHRMGSRIHVYPNGSLFVGSVTEKDGGDYLCVARNNMGDDLTLMHVSLRRKPAKIDHKHHFKKQVFHGKDFQVDCKASGSPVPEISWSLPDGTMINSAMQADDSGRRTRRLTLFHNGTLYFNKVGMAEEGNYTCYAQNTLGKDEMQVHLTVITAAPRIQQTSKTNTRITAGDTAVLDCEVVGEPEPKIFWLLPSNDMISFSKDRYTVHANGSLSISGVRLLDSGQYVCVARNPSGDDTRAYKLDVVSKPPLINGLYANKTVIKATAVRHSKRHFDCRAEGTPSPQIMWIMPENIFLTAPYYGSRITVHRNGTLEIRNMRLSDSADFTCVARNEGGESVLVIRLEVVEMLRRPTFRNPFNEKVVAQLGKSTALNCSVDGNPPPEIIWILPNGTQFPTYDRGNYICQAQNSIGRALITVPVMVVAYAPRITSRLPRSVRTRTGMAVQLHCKALGVPKPEITWEAPDHSLLSAANRGRTRTNRPFHPQGTLVIRNPQTSDSGIYRCTAKNSLGSDYATTYIQVV
ncbi:IGSF10 [Cervus elaphus hippelaphus]|uniref:Immunoglobulin superfamily member 10 n=1 Tax=Cervus elaphus hippelaphus TaxID=46360 RepID=A0A212CII4_CEREH|nr:IGSF10 [Cervus elaphus hippelaphus]